MSRGITLAPSGLIIERVESEAVGLLIVARPAGFSDIPARLFRPTCSPLSLSLLCIHAASYLQGSSHERPW